MHGTIGIHHHKIDCIIGCLPEERKNEQEIFIDVKVKAPFSACVQSHDISDTISYVSIADLCTKTAKEQQHLLLEALAVDILDTLFSKYDIEWAWIRIKKPAAIPTAEYALVELERKK